eukprot:CAMPEP_0195508302 /NCGR_PEP_ID=MMETSP0794_2-20130614/1544_1 /TAXON_ID=515487 /ORGANISM="Stephanopyxis turris, Strain CCMP 815" /LENGTH=156 /DNA_ID=CAMNT_0040635221 /DNA_START=107 /DNA_END=577 /DNA_ORIENTATION=+
MRIPDGDHRATYLIYVKDGFRDRKDDYFDSRGSINARQSAEEQLDRMNYYHSIREQRESEKLTTRTILSGTLDDVSNKVTSSTSSVSPMDEKEEVVGKWLSKSIPHLHLDDINNYAHQFVKDGFDSPFMIENELQEEDLAFMKKAHKRAVLKVVCK